MDRKQSTCTGSIPRRQRCAAETHMWMWITDRQLGYQVVSQRSGYRLSHMADRLLLVHTGKGGTMRILVVEDEKKLAHSLKRGLEEELYAVDIALDGEEGWYLSQVYDYDLI